MPAGKAWSAYFPVGLTAKHTGEKTLRKMEEHQDRLAEQIPAVHTSEGKRVHPKES